MAESLIAFFFSFFLLLENVVGGSDGQFALIVEVQKYFFQRSKHLKIGGTIHLSGLKINVGACNNLNSLVIDETQYSLKF